MFNGKRKISINTWKIYFLLILFWTLLIGSIVGLEQRSLKEDIEEMAITEARANFNKDMAIRHWAAMHGGVYVTIDSSTLPNPGLSHLVERDISTPSGKKLTLMNPAYLVRQLNEQYSEYYGVVGHITSTKLIRDLNVPDNWEMKALQAFEQGSVEECEFTDINGEPYFRLMQPMYTEKSCLKCHAHQGYAEGDVRGGVSISVPLSPIIERSNQHQKRNTFSFLFIWVVGVAGLTYSNNRINGYINQQKTINAELAIAKEKAEESNQLKDAFLANLSHEIRTPMNGIMGFAELLKRINLSEKSHTRYISLIEQSGRRMLKLINNLVLISKIESRQIQLEKSKVDLSLVMENIYQFFREEALAKGVKLSYSTNLKTENSTILTDEQKLEQILTNLIKNALKFTPRGSIHFSCQHTQNELLFSVKDTGIGISKEYHEFIFKRFGRVVNEYSKNTDGSGLGLSIVKSYVEIMGGKIWVSADYKEGTEMLFTLPYSPAR